MKSTNKFFGYKAAVGACILGLLHQGGTAVFSIFLPSIAESLQVEVGVLMYAVTIATVAAVIASLILGKAIEKLGVKRCLLIASACAGANMLLASFASNVAVIFVCCVFSGLQMGFGTIAVLSILISDWFVDKRSQLIGYVIGFSYLGNMIMMFSASRLQVMFGDWRKCEAILGIVTLIVGILTNIVFVRTPKQMGQKPLGWENIQPEVSNPEEPSTNISTDVGMKEVIRSFSFWAMLIACVGFAACSECVASYGPTYYSAYGADSLTASNVAIVFVFISFLSGLIAGWIAEKFGNKVFTIIVGGFTIIGLLLLYFWPASSDIKLLFVGVCAMGLGMPVAQQLAPTISLEMFGRAVYDSASSILVSGIYIGGALSAVLMNTVISVTGEMRPCYSVAAVIVLSALVLTFLAMFMAPAKKKKAT